MNKPAARSNGDLPIALKIGNGAFSGVVGTAIVFPLDTIKSMMQASSKGLGIVGAARQAFLEGGASRLYRGLFPTLVMVAPEKAVKLGVNDAVRRSFSPDGQVTLLQGMIAGGVAGTVQGIITIPMELVKIRMQCAQETVSMPASERAAASLSARAGVAAAHMLPQPATAASVGSSLALAHPSLHLSPRAHTPGQASRFAAFTASAPAAAGADPALHRVTASAPAARPRLFGAPAPRVHGTGVARSTLGPALPIGTVTGPPAANPFGAASTRLAPSSTESIFGRDSALARATSSLRRGWRIGADVVKTEGSFGLYRAAAPSLLRDVPFGLVFFPAHGAFSSYLKSSTDMGAFAATLVSGVGVGALSAAAVTPADVIKTRLQLPGGFDRYGSTANAFRTVVAEEGPRALMRGALPRALVLAPTFGLSMGVYEVVRDLYARAA